MDAQEASMQPRATAGCLPQPLCSIYIWPEKSFYKEGCYLPRPIWHVWGSFWVRIHSSWPPARFGGWSYICSS